MIINIRGTNGSGKTHLVRDLLGEDPFFPVDLAQYPSPTKKNPDRVKWVEGWGHPGGFLAIGSYERGCGGMDTIPNFALQQNAIWRAHTWEGMAGDPPKHVLCEGVLCSTVFGSWYDFFNQFDRSEVLIAYLDTPLELCLKRIRERQKASGRAEREINTDLVANKMRTIQSTRKKFGRAGFQTVTLNHNHAATNLREILQQLEKEND